MWLDPNNMFRAALNSLLPTNEEKERYFTDPAFHSDIYQQAKARVAYAQKLVSRAVDSL